MVKKLFLILLSALMLCPSIVWAKGNPYQKFERGVVNIITAPVEIPKEIRAHWIKGSEKTYHIIVWILAGTFKGIVMTGARTASGVWDIATFPIKVPADYGSVIKPAYVYENWPKRDPAITYKNLGDKLPEYHVDR